MLELYFYIKEETKKKKKTHIRIVFTVAFYTINMQIVYRCYTWARHYNTLLVIIDQN